MTFSKVEHNVTIDDKTVRRSPSCGQPVSGCRFACSCTSPTVTARPTLIERSGVPGRTDGLGRSAQRRPGARRCHRRRAAAHSRRLPRSALTQHVDDVAADLSDGAPPSTTQDYDELVLWFEHDLFDQLNLIQLLTHLGGRPRSKPVTLVCIDSLSRSSAFQGARRADARRSRRAVRDPPARDALSRSRWRRGRGRAFRSPDPRAIEALLAGDTSALPFLAPALARHLEEFPSASDGLSRSERRLMEQALDGPAEIRQAFPRMHRRRDGVLHHRLVVLSIAPGTCRTRRRR